MSRRDAPSHRPPVERAEQREQDPAVALLLAWYNVNGRHQLPWRKTTDPYHILVSELMLQQTQVSRVIPKYEAFLAAFPTLDALANAQRREVLQLWQGLGYNSRAARLHALAALLVTQRKQLPSSREELLALPGIGPYTAGAVRIFAHDVPDISVDVNVARVLRRLHWAPQTSPSKAQVEQRSLALITQSGTPRHWHSALMDLGSSICTAKSPRCDQCPLFRVCHTRGVRPDERKGAKQSLFKGSVRWWRGQILKRLLQQHATEGRLIYLIKEQPSAEDEDLYAAALQGMLKEGIISKHGSELRIK